MELVPETDEMPAGLLRAAFAELPIAVLLLQPVRGAPRAEAELELRDWNPAAESILGSGNGLARGVLHEVLPGLTTPELTARFREVTRTGHSSSHEFCDRSRGTPAWFSVYLAPAGTGLVATFTEITATRKLRLTHAHQARILEEMYEQAPFSACIVAGQPAVFEFTNEAFEELVGVSGLVGTRLDQEFPKWGAGRDLQRILLEVDATGKRHALPEQPLSHGSEDPTRHHYRIIAQPLETPSGRARAIQLVAFDVSALVESRLRAEELAWQLAEEEEQYRATFTEAPVGIAHVDLSGTIREANEYLARLLGYEVRDLLGIPFPSLAHPDDRTGEDPLTLVGRGTRARARNEGRYLTRDGHVVWVTLTVSMLRDRQGLPKHMVAIIEDISGLVSAKRKLEESSRHKDEFLAVLSHELRTPLSALRTASHLFSEINLDDHRLEKIRGTLDRQTAQMKRLIDDLLDLGRIGRGKLNLLLERIDLASVVRRALCDAELLARPGLQLRSQIPDTSVFVQGDGPRLQQVCQNLLTNALKYTPDGGEVTARLDVTEDSACLIIEDTGVGIEPAFLDKLFVPFEQAPQDLGRAEGGLGLGLALTAQIVEMHGGRIEAHSPGRGRGAIFSVWLPLVEASQAVASQPAATSRRGQPSAPEVFRFLLIEDNRDAAELLAMLLEGAGHRVTIATSGREGLELARSTEPDVILCDLGLPGLSGFEVAERIRADAQGHDVALIALSGYGTASDVERGQLAGFDAHLTKPADPDEILSACVRARSARRAPG